MKILHTSDWHLGRSLYGRQRYDEFEAFLGWLLATIQQHDVRTLLVSGDIFDNSTPSTRAQELYYRFLGQTIRSSCRHIVIIAGNHDSPAFLDAPQQLLKALDIHIVGHGRHLPEEEVLVLHDEHCNPELIVCAVPYLHDRDIRTSETGESADQKEQKLLEGIRTHYANAAALAEQKRKELGGDIPVVAMGHLFTAGGQTVDGDGVRELYVGSLAHVTAGIFPENLDYVALGHLHVPQTVNHTDTIRYSGSPLPMGFGEARQHKSVCLVEFQGTIPTVHSLGVPVFQRLESIRGNLDTLMARIRELTAENETIWLEIIYEGAEVIGDLREQLESAVKGTLLDIIRVNNQRIIDRVLERTQPEETLDDLDIHDVFSRCLDAHDIPQEQRPALTATYREAVFSLENDEPPATQKD
jgi:exonuclease SbcD